MVDRKALVALALLLSGCTTSWPHRPDPVETNRDVVQRWRQLEYRPAEVGSVETPPATPAVPPPPPAPTVPAGAVEYVLGEGIKLRALAAEGAMPSVRRTVQLFRQEDGAWQLVNEVNVPYLPGQSVSFSRQDLPGYPRAIILEARRSNGARHSAVAIKDGRLVALDYHRLVAPAPEVTQGALIYLNKYMNQVWVFRDGRLAATYPTANGRDPWGSQPTWQDVRTNYKTPEGLFVLKQKIVNPPYNNFGGNHPPAEGGAPNNPLGTRWMGFEVLSGDGGGIWGFHGTYVPEQIGTWASEGCVRLNTADAEKMYELVTIGTKVRIVSGR